MKTGTERKDSFDQKNNQNNIADEDEQMPFQLTILPLRELNQFEEASMNGEFHDLNFFF
jgi:hypothetical protein